MANLVAAVVFFLGIHFGISGTALRGRLVRLIGEKAFRGLFALASIAGLIWLIRAYSTAPYVRTWGRLIVLEPLAAAADAGRGRVRRGRNLDAESRLPPAWSRSSHAECRCAASRASRGIRSCGALRSGRSCISSSTATWLQRSCSARCSCSRSSALRPSMRSVATLTARRWEHFSRETSNVPFAAILQRRNHFWPALREIGFVRPLIAVAVFVALFLLHGRLFGAPLT